MTAVYCAGCGATLTRPLRRAAAGVAGTVELSQFFVDANPKVVIGATEREVDPAGAIVVHPDDRIAESLGTVEGHSFGCCGLDGTDGPNQACTSCGRIVGTARTDCWIADHEMRFWPTEVHLR